MRSDIIIYEKGEFMKYDRFENETYNLYTIETSKFKSCHMELVFRCSATKENITYLAMLTEILLASSKVYPTKKLLSRKLYDLYNVGLSATNSRVGEIILTNMMIDFLDPKFTDMETLEDSIKLFFEMIFEPNADEFEFDELTFERIKRELSSEIKSLKEDPKQSSILGAFRELDSNDVRSFNASGDLAILEAMTPKKLYEFYLKFIERSPRDIYVVGNLNMKSIDKIVRKYAKFMSIIEEDYNIYLPGIKFKNSRSVTVDSHTSQTNLVQIYTLDNLTDRERDYVMPLFNMLWGSGSLESKLYKSLRGENSLCYNVNAFYQKYDRVLIVHTAIDDEKTTLALKLISKALASMRKGLFEDDELENVKNMLESSLFLGLDNPNRLIDSYVFRNIAGLKDIESRIDEIRKVTPKDIVNVSKKVHLALTYRVRGE